MINVKKLKESLTTDNIITLLDSLGADCTKQMAYNSEHGIVPQTITKAVFSEVVGKKTDNKRKFVYNKDGVMDAESIRKEIKSLTQKMKKAAENLEFEEAADIRDAIHRLEDDLLLLE